MNRRQREKEIQKLEAEIVTADHYYMNTRSEAVAEERRKDLQALRKRRDELLKKYGYSAFFFSEAGNFGGAIVPRSFLQDKYPDVLDACDAIGQGFSEMNLTINPHTFIYVSAAGEWGEVNED